MIENMDKCIDIRGNNYLNSIFHDIASSMGCITPGKAIEKFRSILTDLEINSLISEHISSDVSILASSVNPIRLRNNPIELNESTIIELYRLIVK